MTPTDILTERQAAGLALSLDPTEPAGAAELYLRMLRAFAPARALLDVRYRADEAGLARFFMDMHAGEAARTLVRIGQRTDVYVGVAPRVRRRGGREDIAPSTLLWADCDELTSIAKLRAFTPAASMIVTTGGGEHPHENAHAYWALTRCLSIGELEDANRRLAAALAADPRCADGTRILRVPGTLNFKYRPPRPVKLREYNGARYRPVEILTALPPMPTVQRPPARSRNRTSDPLLQIEPAYYVRVLTGRQVGREGKIHCPLHADERPSFHVYEKPEQGWTCFGCTSTDGRPLGGDIYTLASLLWSIPARRADFLKLREALDALFGVQRG
jgi:hypothetical protein